MSGKNNGKITLAQLQGRTAAGGSVTNIEVGALVRAGLIDRAVAGEFVINRLAEKAERKGTPIPTFG